MHTGSPHSLRRELWRDGALPAVVLWLLLFVSTAQLRGQDPPPVASPPAPDSVAREFQSALRAMAWRAVVQRLHPEALSAFHERVSILVESDTTRDPLEALYPDGGLEAYRARSPRDVFLRAMEVLTQLGPGLVHALVFRDVEILGSVSEPPDLAHVVYRSQEHLSGAVPELRVMTMKEVGESWKVLESPEVEVIFQAFRGVVRQPR